MVIFKVNDFDICGFGINLTTSYCVYRQHFKSARLFYVFVAFRSLHTVCVCIFWWMEIGKKSCKLVVKIGYRKTRKTWFLLHFQFIYSSNKRFFWWTSYIEKRKMFDLSEMSIAMMLCWWYSSTYIRMYVHLH